MVSVKTSAQIWIRICTVQIWSDTDMFYTRADSVASIHIVLPILYNVHKEYVSDFNNFKILKDPFVKGRILFQLTLIGYANVMYNVSNSTPNLGQVTLS